MVFGSLKLLSRKNFFARFVHCNKNCPSHKRSRRILSTKLTRKKPLTFRKQVLDIEAFWLPPVIDYFINTPVICSNPLEDSGFSFTNLVVDSRRLS